MRARRSPPRRRCTRQPRTPSLPLRPTLPKRQPVNFQTSGDRAGDAQNLTGTPSPNQSSIAMLKRIKTTGDGRQSAPSHLPVCSSGELCGRASFFRTVGERSAIGKRIKRRERRAPHAGELLSGAPSCAGTGRRTCPGTPGGARSRAWSRRRAPTARRCASRPAFPRRTAAAG